MLAVPNQLADQPGDGLLSLNIPLLPHIKGHIQTGIFIQKSSPVAFGGQSLLVQSVQIPSDSLLRHAEQDAQLAYHHFALILQFFKNQIPALHRQHPFYAPCLSLSSCSISLQNPKSVSHKIDLQI